jgi:hypothetical protein
MEDEAKWRRTAEDQEQRLEIAAANEKECEQKLEEYKRQVTRLNLAEQRCQLDKNDLRKSLAQSQEASRREADEFSDRIDKLTAERDRYKKLVNKSESSLNTANSTIDGLSEEIKRMQLKFGKNSADAGGGTIARVPPSNTSSEPAAVQGAAIAGDSPGKARSGTTDVEGPVGPEEHDPAAVAGNRFLPWTFLLQAQRETSTKRSAGQKCMFLDFHH